MVEAASIETPRARYEVADWPDDDGALQQPGGLMVWVTPEALSGWHPPGTGLCGRLRDDSDVA